MGPATELSDRARPALPVISFTRALDVVGLVVDGKGSALALDKGGFLRGADQANRSEPGRLGELQERNADAAGRRMNEDKVAGIGAAEIKQELVRGGVVHRHRGSFLKAHAIGNRHDIGSTHNHIFGIAAAA